MTSIVSEQPGVMAAPSRRSAFLRTWRFAAFLESLSVGHRSVIWLGIVAFYLLAMNGLWRMGADSALYLSLGRSIARGEGYTYLGEAHRLAYPGVPYLFAAATKISSQHAVAITTAFMVGCALLSLVLCEQLFRLVVRPGTALVATAMLACSYQVYGLSFEILTDIPFLLGTAMVLLGGAWCGIMPAPRLDDEAHTSTRRQHLLGWTLLPIGLGICAVMRPTFYALAACVVLSGIITIFRERKLRYVLAALCVAALVAGVYLLVSSSDPRRTGSVQDIYEEAMSWHISNAMQNIQVPLANAWKIVCPELPTAFFGFSMTWADPIATLLILFAAGWVLWRWPAAMIWIGLTLGVQCIVEPVPRYMVPILPLLVLAWWTAAARISERISMPSVANVISLGAYALLVPGLCRCVGQVWYEQYRRPFAQFYHGGSYAAVDEAADLIRRRLPANAVIIAPPKTSRVLTYLTDRWCLGLGESIPAPARSRPLYVIFGQSDAAAREIINSTLAPRPKIGQTNTAFHSSGVLILKPASFPP